MERISRAIAASLLVSVILVSPSSKPDAAGQDALTRLRIALGGETALAGVQTLRARGTIATLPFKGPVKSHFDIALALPDRFVTVLRDFTWSDASFGVRRNDVSENRPPEDARRLVRGEISAYEHVSGFDRGNLIPALGPWTRRNDPKTQGNIAQRLDLIRAKMTEFLLPLMGGAPSHHLVDSVSEGQAITFKAKGDLSWRLELDPVTNLPSRMSWTPRGQRPRHTVFSEFRSVGGLQWPHRMVTTIIGAPVDGLQIDDARITSYDLNGSLPEKLFRK